MLEYKNAVILNQKPHPGKEENKKIKSFWHHMFCISVILGTPRHSLEICLVHLWQTKTMSVQNLLATKEQVLNTEDC